MNQNERLLFHYCKTGELVHLKQLIEKEDINLNIRDCWDSTPLYCACLCGHIDLVEYLLENGARCEANSFDGERCMYGALTDQIRSVLRNLKVRTTKLDQYELFLERLYELSPHSDITFEVKDRLFRAHKCILEARSEYFRLKFENKWKNRSWIVGGHELIVPEAFESILKYIYTDRFSTLKSNFGACLRLAKLFKLTDLIEEFQKKLYTLNIETSDNDKQTTQPSSTNNEVSASILNALNNLNNENGDIKLTSYDPNAANPALPIDEADIFLIGKFGASTKLSNVISIEPKDNPISSDLSVLPNTSSKTGRISLDFKQLAYFSLPPQLRETIARPDVSIDLEKVVSSTHDLCVDLSDENEGAVFRVHKAFMAERCEYFKTFLNDPFHEIATRDEAKSSESTTQQKVTSVATTTQKPISQLKLKEISQEVFVEIVYFIYSNSFSKEKLEENVLYDVLVMADLYLLPSLKRKCAHELGTHYLNNENIFDLLKLSRVYELKKLEFSCIYYLAVNLYELEKSEQLREIILEDASKLKMRQETDSIDIIDDLRYAINEISMTASLSNLILSNSNLSELSMVRSSSSLSSLSSKNANYKTSFERLVDREKRLNVVDSILQELNLEC